MDKPLDRRVLGYAWAVIVLTVTALCIGFALLSMGGPGDIKSWLGELKAAFVDKRPSVRYHRPWQQQTKLFGQFNRNVVVWNFLDQFPGNPSYASAV